MRRFLHDDRPVATATPSTAVRASAPTAKVTEVYDAWWRFAYERQRIYYRRLGGEAAPWTDNPTLAQYRFTNAYRAADRVSQYLIKNVIYDKALPHSANEVVFRVLLFKLFNRIETWEALTRELGAVVLADKPLPRIDEILTNELSAGRRIYSAAYIMPTFRSHGTGSRKHQTHLELLRVMMTDRLGDRLADVKSMRAGFDLLRSYPMIGDFLAYQFITDLNYSDIVDFSETEFVAAGPGAREGLRKCFADRGGRSDSELIRMMVDIQEQEFKRLELDFQDLFGRPLQLIDCQNLFCEVAKYARVRFPGLTQPGGRTRIKQKYHPGTASETPFFPPKWGINDAVGEFFSRPQAGRELDLAWYQRQAVKTSFHEPVQGGDAITTSLLGLIGEVGEVVTELKKHSREGAAYLAFADRLAEEVGDVLWYAADLAAHRGIRLADLGAASTAPARSASTQQGEWIRVALSLVQHAARMSRSYDSLLAGRQSSRHFDTGLGESLAGIMADLRRLTCIHGLSIDDVAAANLRKVSHRWAHPPCGSPASRRAWPDCEQLPVRFDAWLSDSSGRVTITFSLDDGSIRVTPDSLTDNAYDPDGYRYHDIFHLAYAAVLGWSPVTRSLLQRKRKSDPRVDEVEDGGRAVVIEEGIAAMVFAYAAQHRMFQGVRTVDDSLLRTIRDMTAHLEVSARTAAEWQDAIIQGFDAWRRVRDAGGGRILVDREARQIRFESGEGPLSSNASLRCRELSGT